MSYLRLIDTHCHLNLAEAFPDAASEIEAAREVGVDRMIIIGIDVETSLAAIRLAEAHDGLFASVGWHPNHANDYRPDSLRLLSDMLAHPKVVAVGETGLDYHWDRATPLQQHGAFTDQLDLAHEAGLPVVIHGRDAYPALMDVLEVQTKMNGTGRYLLHCFAGDETDADRAAALGCYFGVDGPVTYKNAADLRAILAHLDPKRILIETDSPYLPPMPHRGKPNRPSYLPLINSGLAQVLGISPEACAELTTQNAEQFFQLKV